MIKTITERYNKVPCGPQCHVGNHAVGCLNDRQQQLQFRAWLREYEKSGAIWSGFEERKFEEVFAAARAFQNEYNAEPKMREIIPEPVYVCHKCGKEFNEDSLDGRMNPSDVANEDTRKYKCYKCYMNYIDNEYVGCFCGDRHCSGPY